MKGIHVFSEIGKLKKVLLHRPGKEIENLTPDLLERLLFDDVPYLKVAREEHAAFEKILRDNGVEPVFIEELAAQTLDLLPHLRAKFVDDFIFEAKVHNDHKDKLKAHLLTLSNQAMIDLMIAGLETLELGVEAINAYPFVIDPLPNTLFQRDPLASIGNGLTINRMASVTRNRETLFTDLVFRNHPDFAGHVSYFYKRNNKHPLEGGDVLVLNKKALIIGCSERTKMDAIEHLTQTIVADPASGYETVYVLKLPEKRAFMHLDTVFTNIDYDKFIVHPLIFNDMDAFKIYKIDRNGTQEIQKDLQTFLSEIVGKPVQLIQCGGKSPIAAGREQWNDGTNVLALAPGRVISYSRNHVTNQLLRDAGVEVLEIPSSELSRGRGGPRCMSMPLIREDLE